MKKNDEKKEKKGLFKVTKVKVAAAVTALSVLAFGAAHHFGLFETEEKGLDKGIPIVGIENIIGDGDEKEPGFDEDPIVPDENQIEEGRDPELDEVIDPSNPSIDEDYYFDEDDEIDIFDEELETGKTNPVIVDDFADLVIPNINAYKGLGCSIVDALKSCGYPSNYLYRARLAAFFGIPDYRGLDFQNLELLEHLYQYYAGLDNTQNDNANKDIIDNKTGNDNNDGNDKKEEDDKKEETDENHVCSFGLWESLNDEKEIRSCSCGKKEYRNHSWGPWIDLGNGKEVRFCRTCPHTQERTKQQENECKHELGAWKDNGDGTCSRECACGKNKETLAHAQGKLVSSRRYVNGNNEWIEEKTYSCANCGTNYTTSVKLGDVIVKEIPGDDTYHKLVCIIDGKEVEVGTEAHGYDSNGKCAACGHERIKEQECDHTLGEWKDNKDGTCSRECACGSHKETEDHLEGELVSTEYIVENDICIEIKTYKCANCKTTFVKKANHGKVIRVSVDDKTHNLVCETDGRIIASESHSLGEPTVTYNDNGDGTHTKTSVYKCSGCNETITIVETLSHGAGTWEAIDDQYERLVDECGHEIARGEHPYNVTVNDDGSKDYTCPNCNQTKHENAPEHIHSVVEVDRRYLHEDENGNCYVPIMGCVDGDMDTYEGTPVGHDYQIVSDDGNDIEYKCSRQDCNHGYSEEVGPFSLQNFDHEVDEDDDFDYEIEENDDFDLQASDIPSTAFLNLSKTDIEYMADMAIARMELEDALNEEFQEKSLALRYKC